MRALSTHSIVAVSVVGQLIKVVMEISQLVHHQLWSEFTHRSSKRGGVEHVADNRLGTERAKALGLLR
jgi:hypothetical protein